MALKRPKQNPDYRCDDELTYIELVKKHLAQNGWYQKDLAEAANLSKSLVSHMMQNSNGRGGPFTLTDDIVVAVALALKLGRTGWEKLIRAAFPERAYWLEALDNRENVIGLNCRLYENGLPLLGVKNPEE